MNDKSKIIIVFLVVITAILLITTFQSNHRISDLRWQLDTLRNDIHMTQSHQSGISWDLSNRIEALREEVILLTRLSYNPHVQITGYYSETSTAAILVSFYLREISPYDTVTVTARSQDGQSFTANATMSESGRFSAPLTIPALSNYVFTFTARGEVITTGELTQLNIADALQNRFWFHIGQGQTWGHSQPTTVTLWPSLRNITEGSSALDLRALSLSLEIDGEVITTWNLLNYWIRMPGDLEYMLRMEEGLEFTIGEDSDITPHSEIITRLVLHDYLGIRYEQVDQHFFHIQVNWDSNAPVPAQEVRDWEGMGRVIIVSQERDTND